jgi:hypothetical protein
MFASLKQVVGGCVMKLALVLGTCLVSSLLSSVAFAQGPPGPGTVTIINPSIVGGYCSGIVQSGSTFEDIASAYIEATYKGPTGAPASGYVYGLPKMKYKYYDTYGSLMVQPDIMDAAPFSFGNGGYGNSSASASPKCQTFGVLLTITPNFVYYLPEPAKTLIRQWKLLGYAGSQNATGGAECNILCPTFSTTQNGSQPA